MNIKDRLIDQFGKPRGLLGRMAGQIMARRGSNIERNRRTIDLLDPSPGERVLEVGYGPGVAIEEIARRVPGGLVTGVDHSPTMHDVAARRVRRAGFTERVELLVGDANALGGVAPGPFDAVMGVNVAMFWPEPRAVLAELHSRSTPGGRIALAYQPRHSGASSEDTESGGAELVGHLEAVGYCDVTSTTIELAGVPAVVVTGNRARGDHVSAASVAAKAAHQSSDARSAPARATSSS